MTRTLLTILCIIYPLITEAGKPAGRFDHFIYETDLSYFLQTDEIKDFGDAPIIYGPADHIIDSKNYLGSIVDNEPAYQASEEADADDLNGQDDEDGVVFPEMIQGTKASLRVKIVGLAYLNVWIDWNGDGDFLDNDEYIFKNSLRITGTYNLTVSVPENAVISKATFARFRFGPSTSIKPVYNSSGSAKFGEVEDYMIKIQCVAPAPPRVGTITQPTCEVPEGSVILSGLPATGTWILTRLPDGTTTTGKGTSVTISGLESGTFKYTVTNEKGCTSSPSEDIVINTSPVAPGAPLIGKITQPSCTVSTGIVVLSGLPETGTWTLTRFPGTIKTTGTGNSTTISGLGPGTYNYTVTNSQGCTSMASVNIIINVQPVSPSAPVIGAITQPTCIIATGTVVLKGLPASGTWTLTRYPDKVTVTGSGTTITITDLIEGTYNFTITNSSGCTSIPSSDIVIDPQPVTTPVIKITNPAPLCFPETVNLTAPSITEGSTAGLTFTYWKDAKASLPYNTPSQATAGTYYIKGTTNLGCYGIQPVTVTSYQQPVAHAGPDQILKYQFTATLDADYPGDNLTGSWSIIAGSGEFSDAGDAKSTISELAIGKNILLWSVTNGVCPAAEDYVALTVQDLLIPTLITPDMNGKNDFFVLEGLESLGKTSLIIFDRRGMKVFSSENYDNLWHGIDYNGYPLPNDTYFYILRSEKGISLSGFIVVKR